MPVPSFPANTPEPPYFAVIFTSKQGENTEGYEEMAKRMVDLAQQQQGFLGVESSRDSAGNGITVSYWQSEEAIKHWKQQGEHLSAQQQGRNSWYQHYHVRIAKVERAYEFASSIEPPSSS